MAQTRRLMPPAGGGNITVSGGRTYLAATGAQDVPDFDADCLEASGWTTVCELSGTTAARPTGTISTTGAKVGLQKGVRFYDSQVNAVVTWDGKNWRNEAGSIV